MHWLPLITAGLLIGGAFALFVWGVFTIKSDRDSNDARGGGPSGEG